MSHKNTIDVKGETTYSNPGHELLRQEIKSPAQTLKYKQKSLENSKNDQTIKIVHTNGFP